MAKSHTRGHEIYCDFNDEVWRYVDNNKIANYDRQCKKCQKFPTKEGYDACTGEIKNAKHACCGHGVKPGYVIF